MSAKKKAVRKQNRKQGRGSGVQKKKKMYRFHSRERVFGSTSKNLGGVWLLTGKVYLPTGQIQGEPIDCGGGHSPVQIMRKTLFEQNRNRDKKCVTGKKSQVGKGSCRWFT